MIITGIIRPLYFYDIQDCNMVISESRAPQADTEEDKPQLQYVLMTQTEINRHEWRKIADWERTQHRM